MNLRLLEAVHRVNRVLRVWRVHGVCRVMSVEVIRVARLLTALKTHDIFLARWLLYLLSYRTRGDRDVQERYREVHR